jgi:hypothetical protein
LRGKLGDKLEAWEMNRKIARFSKQEGFGEETVFTAEICQGNFHHHRKWTKGRYEEKVSSLAEVHLTLSTPSSAAGYETPSPRTARGAHKS